MKIKWQVIGSSVEKSRKQPSRERLVTDLTKDCIYFKKLAPPRASIHFYLSERCTEYASTR